MTRYLIATHGTFAEGIHSALTMILGENQEVKWMNCYQEGEREIKDKVKQIIQDIPQEDELIICTDVFGGSVNNEFMEYVEKEGVHLICGVNLTLIITLLMSTETSTEDRIRDAIEQAKDGIMYCNNIDDDKVSIDEEF